MRRLPGRECQQAPEATYLPGYEQRLQKPAFLRGLRAFGFVRLLPPVWGLTSPVPEASTPAAHPLEAGGLIVGLDDGEHVSFAGTQRWRHAHSARRASAVGFSILNCLRVPSLWLAWPGTVWDPAVRFTFHCSASLSVSAAEVCHVRQWSVITYMPQASRSA
ncbi:unnamed protein product [Symbiodinium natans]|uniref:Uncharacterized protein n=1 Tax=Symbiodinium natans TaxID=878477 RepID=A0A812UN88_9DINO|nr:unnamed protein product [Symbiodinium natans]